MCVDSERRKQWHLYIFLSFSSDEIATSQFRLRWRVGAIGKETTSFNSVRVAIVTKAEWTLDYTKSQVLSHKHITTTPISFKITPARSSGSDKKTIRFLRFVFTIVLKNKWYDDARTSYVCLHIHMRLLRNGEFVIDRRIYNYISRLWSRISETI